MLLLMTVGAAAALWRHHRVESRATSKGARAVSASIFSGRGVSPPVKDPPQVGSTVESDPPPTKTVVPKIAAPKIVLPPPSPALAPPPRASPSTDDTEARLLALALTQLRKQRDPRAALATLDRWERRFPGGVLATEVLSTRIEAAVTMKDLATATRLVESAVVSPGQAGEALRVMRAELRAQSGRCAAALTDFGRLLDDGAVAGIAGELHERALYGRAVCLGRLGQGSAARRDLAAYARHYPHGRFSVEVARLLAQGPPAAAVAP
jgi:hypothetical protein